MTRIVASCLSRGSGFYKTPLTLSVLHPGKRGRCTLLLHGSKFLLQVVLAGAFYPNYFTFGQPDEEMAVRELAGKDPKTTIVVGGGRPSWGERPRRPPAPSQHGWQESV